MKTIIICISIIFLLSNELFGQSDVRDSRWGMTEAEVIKSEGRTPDEEDTGYYKEKELSYNFSVDSRMLKCTFVFTNNRLSSVTYRYYWGEWQKSVEHSFANRFGSISNLFKTLKQKNYASKYGWHMLNEQFTPRGDNLTKCLGQNKYIRDLNNVNMPAVEECFNKHANFSQNGNLYAQVDFENERTRVIVKFPLKNHPNKDEVIGWVNFISKENSKREF